WIARHIRIEREVACDQRVVRRTGAPVVYARSLATAAVYGRRGQSAAPEMALGSSTTRSLLRTRGERLLARSVPRAADVWTGTTVSALALFAAVIGLRLMPTIVAFAESPAALLKATTVLLGPVSISAAGSGIVAGAASAEVERVSQAVMP